MVCLLIAHYKAGWPPPPAEFLTMESRLLLLTALPIKYAPAGCWKAHPPTCIHCKVCKRRKGEQGAENTQIRPLSSQTVPSYQEGSQASLISPCKWTFGHLLREEKLQQMREGSILGHTITAICIPPEAGLAQALQLCGVKKSFRKKEMGHSPQSVHPKFRWYTSSSLRVRKWEQPHSGFQRGRVKRPGRGVGALHVWELPSWCFDPRSLLGETNFFS